MELREKLMEFNFYKTIILDNLDKKRNVLVERKDGTHGILTYYDCKYLNNLTIPIQNIERITFFIDGKEFEFVACQ